MKFYILYYMFLLHHVLYPSLCPEQFKQKLILLFFLFCIFSFELCMFFLICNILKLKLVTNHWINGNLIIKLLKKSLCIFQHLYKVYVTVTWWRPKTGVQQIFVLLLLFCILKQRHRSFCVRREERNLEQHLDARHRQPSRFFYAKTAASHKHLL